ncbi:MAG TPA: DNA helicase RecG, partial [Anaeromyxobacteraceae bacterium]
MPGSASGNPPGGVAGLAAAQHLAALVPPLRFAARDGFAGLPRLSGFGELVRASVARARGAGAPESPALRGLLAEAAAFDALALADKRQALLRVAG